ncbi:sulfotransferase [bacterium]|nr:sulfotransferase [bacterium]
MDSVPSIHLHLGGFPSGGTDLLRLVCNAHPSILIQGELPFYSRLLDHGYSGNPLINTPDQFDKLIRQLSELDHYDNLLGLRDGQIEAIRTSLPKSVMEIVRAAHGTRGEMVWGDKTPQNSENLATLFSIDPEAKGLIVARDVRDVCLSWNRKWGKHMPLVAEKWRHRMKQVYQLADDYPGRVHVIKFEDLLSDTETVTKGITSFLGIEWSERMLEHHRFVGNVTDGKINFGKPIKAENKRKWEVLPDRTIRRLEEIALPTMELFDYAPKYGAQYRPLGRLGHLRGAIHDLGAMLFVGNRAREDNSLKYRFGLIWFQLLRRVKP